MVVRRKLEFAVFLEGVGWGNKNDSYLGRTPVAWPSGESPRVATSIDDGEIKEAFCVADAAGRLKVY